MLERTQKSSFWFFVGSLYTLNLECCRNDTDYVTFNTVSGFETENISKSSVFMMVSTAVEPSTRNQYVIFLTQNTAGESVEIRFADTHIAANLFLLAKTA